MFIAQNFKQPLADIITRIVTEPNHAVHRLAMLMLGPVDIDNLNISRVSSNKAGYWVSHRLVDSNDAVAAVRRKLVVGQVVMTVQISRDYDQITKTPTSIYGSNTQYQWNGDYLLVVRIEDLEVDLMVSVSTKVQTGITGGSLCVDTVSTALSDQLATSPEVLDYCENRMLKWQKIATVWSKYS